MNKEHAEKYLGADIAAFVDSPDFELIRAIRAAENLRHAFELDPRCVDEFPEKEIALQQASALEDLFTPIKPSTIEGLIAKVKFVYNDFVESRGTTPEEVVEQIFLNVIDFLDNQKNLDKLN